MAKAVINLQKESGGIVKISPVDGIGVTEVTVPESGELVTKEYVDNSSVPFVANDSRVKTALNAGGTAPIYACRAWVNFNGSGTVSIRESGNVSSITDNGVGNYTVNFTTTMSDANYSIGHALGSGGAAYKISVIASKTTATLRFSTCYIVGFNGEVNNQDESEINVAIFR